MYLLQASGLLNNMAYNVAYLSAIARVYGALRAHACLHLVVTYISLAAILVVAAIYAKDSISFALVGIYRTFAQNLLSTTLNKDMKPSWHK